MKIKIEDIPVEGMQVNADSMSNDWFEKLLIDVMGPEKIKPGDGGRFNLQIVKNNKDVTIAGGAALKFHPVCDRCLNIFEKQQQVSFHLMLAPAKKEENVQGKGVWEEGVSRRQTSRSPHLDNGEDFGFYKGDEIDVSEIVREQIILAQEIVNVCKDTCKGLCQICGKNKNKNECRCEEKLNGHSPFEMLKKIQRT